MTNIAYSTHHVSSITTGEMVASGYTMVEAVTRAAERPDYRAFRVDWTADGEVIDVAELFPVDPVMQAKAAPAEGESDPDGALYVLTYGEYADTMIVGVFATRAACTARVLADIAADRHCLAHEGWTVEPHVLQS